MCWWVWAGVGVGVCWWVWVWVCVGVCGCGCVLVGVCGGVCGVGVGVGVCGWRWVCGCVRVRGCAPCAALLVLLSARNLGPASNSDLDTVSIFKLQSLLLDSSRFSHDDVADGREKSVTAGVVLPLGSPVCCGSLLVWSGLRALRSCLSTVMKRSNVMPVFVLSCTMGLQLSTRARFVSIAWILAGASMAVSGKVLFAMAGFVFLLVSHFGVCGETP